MNGVNSEDIHRKLSDLSLSHFSTIFYRTQSRVSTGINSISDFTFPYSFFKAHTWTILRIGHWDKFCIFCVYSHFRKAHSCIESTCGSGLDAIVHTILIWLDATFLSNKLQYYLQSERCSYRFFFINILIRLSHTNRIHCYYALGASFRNLFLKTTKYYAKALLSKILWSEARQAEPRRSSVTLRAATHNSTLSHPCSVHSIT